MYNSFEVLDGLAGDGMYNREALHLIT